VYASDATTFKQLTYGADQQSLNVPWYEDQTLHNLDGHSSPACYNRGQGSLKYLMAVNKQNQVNVFWQDTNTNQTNTTTHPTGVWTNATSFSISNISSPATLGFTKYLYAQDSADDLIRAYNINFAAENTTLNDTAGFVVQGNTGIQGTGLSVTARPDSSGKGDDVIALYQTDTENQVGYYERDPDDVSWNSAIVNIPLQ
jgi:hypothetical protein